LKTEQIILGVAGFRILIVRCFPSFTVMWSAALQFLLWISSNQNPEFEETDGSVLFNLIK